MSDDVREPYSAEITRYQVESRKKGASDWYYGGGYTTLDAAKSEIVHMKEYYKKHAAEFEFRILIAIDKVSTIYQLEGTY